MQTPYVCAIKRAKGSPILQSSARWSRRQGLKPGPSLPRETSSQSQQTSENSGTGSKCLTGVKRGPEAVLNRFFFLGGKEKPSVLSIYQPAPVLRGVDSLIYRNFIVFTSAPWSREPSPRPQLEKFTVSKCRMGTRSVTSQRLASFHNCTLQYGSH